MQVFEGFEKLFHFCGRSAGVVSHRDECCGTWGKGRSLHDSSKQDVVNH